ncbi:tripartite tricarboxylate transporter substrate binding protein [Variovorax ureilyticus]|uniref:Tripartite tricarboxylate transporter substrate binding protein n=1 Tax=Variovorax ureilyticus TaxID=1836198 RepID=A0ABU8VR14_9BURK
MASLPRMTRRTFAAGTTLAMLSPWALAQGYPTKTVKWVVGFPPGGGTDVLARTVAAQLSTQFGQQVIVDNKAGAAGMIAAESVARAEPDGYTLLTADIAILALNPAIYPKVRYNPLTDFVPVGLMARFPLIVATHPGSGITSLQQLVADARKGKSFNYGSAGVGTPHHMAMEVLASSAGITAQHVPYKGDSPAMQDVAGKQLPVAVISPSLSLPFIKDGRLVPLAVTGDQRMAQLPDVPTLKELGFAPSGIYAWQGLVVPKSTPPHIVSALSAEMRQALALAAVRQKLAELGMEATPSDSAEMDRYIREEMRFWDKLIKSRGITST